MLLNDVLGNAFHAKYFDIETSAVGKRIIDRREGLFVDLAHVNRETYVLMLARNARERTVEPLTSGSIEPSSASFTFEMLCLLMIDQDLLIIEIPFAIVAPWPTQYFIHPWMIALLPAHLM